MKYYLIVGNIIKSEIERSIGDVTALPLLDEARAVSLINQEIIGVLKEKEIWDDKKTFEMLGLIDERVKSVKA